MPGPTLPTELLIKIVDFVAHTAAFDFTQLDWGTTAHLPTLVALCLTSAGLNEIASRRLYHHLVLPTPWVELTLARTVQSERWQTGVRAGKAAEWIRRITFGQPVKVGCEADGVYVRWVLAGLSGVQLERVAVIGIGLELELDSLAYMTSKSSQAVSRVG